VGSLARGASVAERSPPRASATTPSSSSASVPLGRLPAAPTTGHARTLEGPSRRAFRACRSDGALDAPEEVGLALAPRVGRGVAVGRDASPRRRGRASGRVRPVRVAVLGLVCLLSACGPVTSSDDAGLPPPRDADGGTADAGGMDAGRSDAGVADGGRLACELDAGPELARDGGSLVCAPCSSATGCGAGGVCGFVQASSCTGSCSFYGGSCVAPGPEATRFTVTVQLDSFGCPNRHPGGCDFVHELDPQSGMLTLSLRLLGDDAGVGRGFGAVFTDAGVAVLGASVSDLWCAADRDLFADRCVDRSPILRVDAEAPDAGIVVTWPLRAGQLPPEALFSAVTQVLRAGDAVFRDAGVAWSRSPP